MTQHITKQLCFSGDFKWDAEADILVVPLNFVTQNKLPQVFETIPSAVTYFTGLWVGLNWMMNLKHLLKFIICEYPFFTFPPVL